jgi:DNA-binding NarL/FixJ family response regulator
VLLVDDHQVVRMGLATVIRYQPDLTVAGEAASAEEAVLRYRETRPGVVLLDLRIPGGGLAALRSIRAADPAARVLLLSTFEAEEDIHQARSDGALGYLSKSTPAEAILVALRRAARGEPTWPPAILAKLEQRAQAPALSPREKEVLGWVARGESNREIARRLGFTEHTAKAHLKQILVKMGVGDRTEAAVESVRRGLVRLD